MALTPAQRSQRARLAALSRWDPEKAREARREFELARFAEPTPPPFEDDGARSRPSVPAMNDWSRSAYARAAAHASWARTPNRAERTAPARANNPASLDYWIRKIEEEGTVRPRDREAAAESAWRAHQARVSAAAAEARRRRATKTTQQ